MERRAPSFEYAGYMENDISNGTWKGFCEDVIEGRHELQLQQATSWANQMSKCCPGEWHVVHESANNPTDDNN